MSVPDGCKKSELRMYIVGNVSINSFSSSCSFLLKFRHPSTALCLCVFPEIITKGQRRHLQILIRMSCSFLSWSLFPDMDGEAWCLCFLLFPLVHVIISVFTSILHVFCSENVPCLLFWLIHSQQAAGAETIVARCCFAPLPHVGEKQEQMWGDWNGNSRNLPVNSSVKKATICSRIC